MYLDGREKEVQAFLERDPSVLGLGPLKFVEHNVSLDGAALFLDTLLASADTLYAVELQVDWLDADHSNRGEAYFLCIRERCPERHVELVFVAEGFAPQDLDTFRLREAFWKTHTIRVAPAGLNSFTFTPANVGGEVYAVPDGAWWPVEVFFLQRGGTLADCAGALKWDLKLIENTFHKRLKNWRTWFEICKTGDTTNPTIRFKYYPEWKTHVETDPKWARFYPHPQDFLAACIPSKFRNRKEAEQAEANEA